MAAPIVRRTTNQSSSPQEAGRAKSRQLLVRRVAAWVTEITLFVASGLMPFGIGVYLNSNADLNRVQLNPILVATERTIARPLALPVNYGTRHVAWPTNFLWTVAILAPLTLSCWQLYLLAKIGSTIPKSWFGVRVVNSQGQAPGLGAVLLREGIGRWTGPISIAYVLWYYSAAFPNLGVFTGLCMVILLAEGIGLPWQQGRRALHDRLAGTYTIDAKTPFTPSFLNENTQSQDEEAAIASIVITPQPRDHSSPRQWKQQNPNITLLVVALSSMAAVLATLIGTQIYIQTQQNQRATEQNNSQQFLALVKRLNFNSGATNDERRGTILALGTLNDPQAIQFLVDLLAKETDPILLDTIQQALVSLGPIAIPDLKRMNQYLANDLESVDNNKFQQPELRQKQLSVNQQAINKILRVYSGQTNGIDLAHALLGQSGSLKSSSFNLTLDKVDLSGINFKSANLNQASFKGTRFHGVGDNGRWDTYDDWIADLTQAQMKQANLTDAILSRVLMNRADLSRAILKRANLSNARLIGANLSSAQLAGADLSGAVLENASLTGADLGQANLNEAELYAAHLGRVIAIGTQLSYANLTKTDWQGADLSGAYLNHANLGNANLSATRLTGTIFRSANMENVNLRNADLSLADLQGADLAGSDFQGAILSPSKQDPTDQFVQKQVIGSQSAVVKGVDFSQVKNLDAKQLAYICTQGGIHPRCP
ncbi:MAG: pentapeptide repeat-containing protein [Stigonema ocellatum SAG 48.90 = DSM 106950]|nr:pentapeptide repeat-containing protein [Stigonema ocellatum SAG 48.90 = DSM 106950]